MLLNPLSQNFAIWLPANFFYCDVVNLWKPVMKRMYLPYLTIEDMFNSQITAVSFPSISTSNVNQTQQNYNITKRGGKQLDQTMEKTLTLTIKLSESYMTYFIARQQFELFEKWGYDNNLYLPPINITILDEGGFENITYTYYQITPTTLSDFDLSYSAKPGSFNTFTWSFTYNYFEIWYRDSNGNRVKMDIDVDNGQLKDVGAPKIGNKNNIIGKNTNIERFDNAINVRSMLK